MFYKLQSEIRLESKVKEFRSIIVSNFRFPVGFRLEHGVFLCPTVITVIEFPKQLIGILDRDGERGVQYYIYNDALSDLCPAGKEARCLNDFLVLQQGLIELRSQVSVEPIHNCRVGLDSNINAPFLPVCPVPDVHVLK